MQGSSPGAASPPAPKRSPTARFSGSVNESSMSPRGSVSRHRAHAGHDDDAGIPTSSLHDDPPRAGHAHDEHAAASAAAAIPLPPALEPDADTTTLHVFGPPFEFLATLRAYLESIGPVVSYLPGPDGSNWWVVTYGNPLSASFALRRHGEIVNGRWMLGFKVAGPGSTQGLTLVSGVSPPAVNSTSAGNAIELKSSSIIRPKPKASEVAKEDYAWEEPEQPSGLFGRAAELIVSSSKLRDADF